LVINPQMSFRKTYRLQLLSWKGQRITWLTLQSPVVTVCTASLTFTNSTFCPHGVLTCFVWVSEQTAIVSLHSINWLVFTTEAECVYCAVRTESLKVIQDKLSLSHKGPGSIPSQSMWDLWWTKWHWDRFFSQYSRSPLSVSFHQGSKLFFSCMLLLPGQTGEAWEPFIQQCAFGNRGPLDRKVLPLFS
jgi:hypothetical protein